MNGVLLASDAAEDGLLASYERDDLATQVAELRADVRHIQSDTTDIKAELRITNQRIDTLSQRFEQRFESSTKAVDERFDTLSEGFEQRFEKVDRRFDTLTEQFEQRFEKIDQRFESSAEAVDERFDKVERRFEKVDRQLDELKDALASAKIWALGLYLALSSSMLYVLARGFKWL